MFRARQPFPAAQPLCETSVHSASLHCPLSASFHLKPSTVNHSSLSPFPATLTRNARGGVSSPSQSALFFHNPPADVQQSLQPFFFHGVTSRFPGYPGGGGAPVTSILLFAQRTPPTVDQRLPNLSSPRRPRSSPCR